MKRSKTLVVIVLAVAMFGGGAILLAADPGTSNPTTARAFTADGLIASELVSTTDIDATIVALQTRLRTENQDPLDLASLGAAYLQKARATADATFLSLADKALSRSLTLQPHNIPALLGRGELALTRHDFTSALRHAKRVLHSSEINATALGILGDAHLGLGHYQDAFRIYQEMVDLRPDLSSYARVSYARELTGDVDGAIRAMQRALVAGAAVPENEAWTSTQLGDLFFGSGRLGRARLHYAEALERSRDFTPALAGLAKVDAASGRWDMARARYQKVVARMPLPQYVIALGDVYAAMGKRGLAEQSYDLVRAQNRIYTSNGVLPDVEITMFLADQGGNPERALTLARAQWRDRKSVPVADAFAWALYRNGAISAARAMSERAFRLGAVDATMLYHAGMIALANGDTSLARRRLSDALEANSHFSVLYASDAQKALDGLEKQS
jgi:tetratricopeptide (TPR) repeat protein